VNPIGAAAFLVGCLLFGGDDDWYQWRGPNNDGMARGDAPTTWSDSANVLWRVNVPGRGQSSPVIWGNKLFLTTAISDTSPGSAGPGKNERGGNVGSGRQHKFVVICLNRDTGKVIWERVAKTATPHEGYHQQYGSFASNTPATDGRYVYAFFGSRGLYCYDLDGKLIWEKQFPPMRMRLGFGEGVAPVVDGNLIFLKFDQEENSYFLVLDKRNGQEVWRAKREEISSWSQPLVVAHNGRKQVVVSATNKVRSYEPATGKVIWECAGLGVNVIPSPVAFDGMVFVMSGHRDPNMLAIRLGREGDLTGTDAIVWTNNRGNSYTPSPVLDGGKLYFVTDNGLLSCLNARTGEAYYRQQRLGKPHSLKASPVGANGRLYIPTEDGDVVLVRMGEKFELLATNTLADQMFIATPAIANGRIYLRGQNTLFCIGQ
jgi:outer membrane protein assembly factor BamB